MNSSDTRLSLNAFIVLTAFTAILVGCSASTTMTDSSASASTAAMDSSASSITITLDEDTNASAYKDGTYTADGQYVSPAGEEHVGVTLTLADGVITDAQFEGKTQHPTSKIMQGKFSEGYNAVVVGKSIDELSLTVVNGSSLTPKGFMDAVAKIKVEAKA
jgi:hypothetical protein